MWRKVARRQFTPSLVPQATWAKSCAVGRPRILTFDYGSAKLAVKERLRWRNFAGEKFQQVPVRRLESHNTRNVGLATAAHTYSVEAMHVLIRDKLTK